MPSLADDRWPVGPLALAGVEITYSPDNGAARGLILAVRGFRQDRDRVQPHTDFLSVRLHSAQALEEVLGETND